MHHIDYIKTHETTQLCTNIQNNSRKSELKRYTLFKSSRGHYCTKIHNRYVDALRQELFISRLLLTTTDAPLHAAPTWDDR